LVALSREEARFVRTALLKGVTYRNKNPFDLTQRLEVAVGKQGETHVEHKRQGIPHPKLDRRWQRLLGDVKNCKTSMLKGWGKRNVQIRWGRKL